MLTILLVLILLGCADGFKVYALTERNYLNNNTLNEIIRLKVKKIFIIGGTGVITDKVEKNIRSLNVEIERLSGADRYETSVKIAEVIKGVLKSTPLIILIHL